MIYYKMLLLPGIERRSIRTAILHTTKLLRIRMTHWTILLQATVAHNKVA